MKNKNLEQQKEFLSLKKTAQFYKNQMFSCTESFHRLTIDRSVIFTDGVKEMCRELECFWLADIIGSYSHVLKRLEDDFFAIYFIRKETCDGEFFITDGNNFVHIKQEIEFTDIEKDVYLFMGKDDGKLIVMLPSEY